MVYGLWFWVLGVGSHAFPGQQARIDLPDGHAEAVDIRHERRAAAGRLPPQHLEEGRNECFGVSVIGRCVLGCRVLEGEHRDGAGKEDRERASERESEGESERAKERRDGGRGSDLGC